MRPWWSRLAVTSVALAAVARIPRTTSSGAASTLVSIAILHTNDSVDTACLAVAVTSDVLVTPAQCVAELLASPWTAQFVSSAIDSNRLVVNDMVDVASVDVKLPRDAGSNRGVGVVRLQRTSTSAVPFTIAKNSVHESDLFSVLHVNLSTLEFALFQNATRLASDQCGIPIQSNSSSSNGFYCVAASRAGGDGDSSVLIDASTPTTLVGFSFPQPSTSISNATAFTLLPTIGDLSRPPPTSLSSSASSSSSDDVQTPDGTMDTYVLTPDGNALTQAPSFMAGLRLTKDGANYCGGSLIASRVVLTAAHCLDSGQVPTFVSIGAMATSGYDDPRVELLAVDIVQLHPQYDQTTKANDLALVFLREPSRSHSAIRLENTRRLSANRATVFGYGVTQQDATELSPTLRSVELPLIASRQQCEAHFGARLDPSFLCAGGETGRDACTGDSGGPLVVMTKTTPSLLGVVSAGDGCGVKGRPGLYTWVGSASAVAFISTHVADAMWTESVRINGIIVPVVPSRDDAVEYPQFVNVSSQGTSTVSVQGTVRPSTSSTQTPQERDGSETTRAPDQHEQSTAPSQLTSPTMLYRVEFGGEDLTAFTRTSLLQFLASGSTSGAAASTVEKEDKTVRFTLVSSARLDALVAIISRHDTLALHRRRTRW